MVLSGAYLGILQSGWFHVAIRSAGIRESSHGFASPVRRDCEIPFQPYVEMPLLSSTSFRRTILWLARETGLFAISRRLTRGRLRILCYHGTSFSDEHEFAPILFMTEGAIRNRLALLRDRGYSVISLGEGLQRLEHCTVGDGDVVITFDDGWKGTLTHAAPLFREFGMPACVYVTTYYCDTQRNLFNIVIWYSLWKTERESVTFSGIHPEFDGTYVLGDRGHDAGLRWIEVADRVFTAAEREALLSQIVVALGLNPAEVLAYDRFKLMSESEIRQISQEFGWEVQLHTHRHVLPEDSPAEMAPEILENKVRLEAWAGQACTDFCYPSGKYHSQHPEWLRSLGLRSATTCDPGLNDAHTDRMLLKRYLDRETWSDLEFEATISGFSEIAARALSAIGLKRN